MGRMTGTKKMNKVWVVSFCTESCDRGVYVFGYKPTNEEIVSFLKKEMPWEYEDGCAVGYEIFQEAVMSK